MSFYRERINSGPGDFCAQPTPDQRVTQRQLGALTLVLTVFGLTVAVRKSAQLLQRKAGLHAGRDHVAQGVCKPVRRRRGGRSAAVVHLRFAQHVRLRAKVAARGRVRRGAGGLQHFQNGCVSYTTSRPPVASKPPSALKNADRSGIQFTTPIVINAMSKSRGTSSGSA